MTSNGFILQHFARVFNPLFYGAREKRGALPPKREKSPGGKGTGRIAEPYRGSEPGKGEPVSISMNLTAESEKTLWWR